LQDYFNQSPGCRPLRSDDAYEILVKKKIIEIDRHQGIKFRDFLKHLKRNNQLNLIPQCQTEETSGKSTNWFFRTAASKTQPIRKLIPLNEAVIKHTVTENEIKDKVNTFPKMDAGKFTDIQLETRKNYHRAYEKWSKEEEKFLIRVVKEIKDPMKLSDLFQRQPSAVKTRLKDHFNIIL
jgi:hypothetical protein